MPIRDRFNSAVVTRARLLALAPLTGLLLWPAATAQQPSALAQAEMQRRAANASEARMLLEKGDEAYEAGRWADAIAAYTGARELLPAAPATAALRDAATERLVQASVEQARRQRRLGDVKGAGETVDRVLDGSVAPDDGLALEMRAQLEDPIRTNPASTLEHAGDVEEVRLLLYKAQGFENLGVFDKASVVYEEVLRVDPTNKAARRGMEVIARHRSDYARAAFDEARASMLSQIDAAWELPLSRGKESFGDLTPGAETGTGRMLMSNKLERIILPMIDFDGVSIREALDFLRQQSIELDTFELDEENRGINFVLEIGGADSEVGKEILATRINLQLKNVPLSEVLRYINEITRTVYVPQEWAVAVRPAGSDSNDLMLRTYRVPPDFLTSGGGAGEGGAADDPFADDGAEGLIPQRLSAEQVLKGQGVTFPDGATATFNAGDSSLRINNTASNHALIEQIVDAVSNTEPAMVQIEVRMIRTQQRILEELGFDWLLGEFSLGGSGLTPGAPAGVISGGTLNPQNMADVALSPGDYFQRALTSGNRSGNEAIIGDSIDDLILEQSQGFSRGNSRAPGILWANGKLNNTDVIMLMRGLDRKKGVDLVVSPSTVTRSGQQSKVEILREFIYPTEYEPPELPNTITTPVLVDLGTGDVEVGTPPLVPITPATPTSFETRGVGVVLDVLPTVSADRYYVDLALSPSVTDFDGFINYGTPITSTAPSGLGGLGGFLGGNNVVEITPNEILMPVFSVMKTETNLTVADGSTLVIGGMLQEKLQKVEDKTKILGDLPILGRMFQSHAYAPVRTAVLFLVTVRVVDPTGQPFRDR